MALCAAEFGPALVLQNEKERKNAEKNFKQCKLFTVFFPDF
jgi:hypothetical protein